MENKPSRPCFHLLWKLFCQKQKEITSLRNNKDKIPSQKCTTKDKIIAFLKERYADFTHSVTTQGPLLHSLL